MFATRSRKYIGADRIRDMSSGPIVLLEYWSRRVQGSRRSYGGSGSPCARRVLRSGPVAQDQPPSLHGPVLLRLGTDKKPGVMTRHAIQAGLQDLQRGIVRRVQIPEYSEISIIKQRAENSFIDCLINNAILKAKKGAARNCATQPRSVGCDAPAFAQALEQGAARS